MPARPRHLVARALADAGRALSACDASDFHAVIDGMEMDAAQDIRAPDLATLDLYCARVASAVGHLSVHVFGDPGPAAHARRRRRSAAPCSSPTSCATSTRTRGAAGSICRARSSTGTASAAPSRARCCAIPALPAVCRDLAAIAERHFAEAEPGDGALLAPRDAAGGGDGRVLPRDARRAAALRAGATRAARVSLSKAAEAVAGAAPRRCYERAAAAGRSMSSAPGWPGWRPRSRWPRHGGAVVALRERRRRPAGAAAPISTPSSACRIDNGNHLLLSGNRAALAYIERDRRPRHVRAAGRGGDPVRRSRDRRALDVAARARAPCRGGCCSRARRVPGTPGARLSRRAAAAARRAPATRSPTVLDPRRRAVPPAVAAARGGGAEHRAPRRARRGCSGASCAETLGRGAAACRPLVPREGLSESLVDPALAMLRAARRRDPLRRPAARASDSHGGRVSRARCSTTATVDAAATTTAWCSRCRPRSRRASCPGLVVPDDYAPIVNAHYRMRRRPRRAAVRRPRRRHRRMGVPQARGHLGDGQRRRPASSIARPRSCAATLWRDVARAFGLAAAAGAARAASSRSAAPRFAPRRRSCGGARRPRRAGATFTLRAIMSIPACPPRSKALFAPALRRRRAFASAAAWRRRQIPARRRRHPPRRHRGLPARAAMNSGMTAPQKSPMPAEADPRPGSTARSRARSNRCCRCSTTTATGCSSSRPTRRSRPNTSCCSITSARSTRELEQRIARYLRADPGRAWRLAAVPRRRVRSQRLGQGLFRAEGGRRPGRRAAHGARPRGDPGARRRARAATSSPASCWRCWARCRGGRCR